MFKNYKIITVTPAGRKNCVEILAKHLLKLKNLIDEHHFWVNTLNKDDIQFLKELSEKHPNFFKLKFHNNVKNHYDSRNICEFFEYCVEENTVYVRFDDDIVWIDDENNFREFLKFRIENPNYFLVSANIINNSICNYLHQRFGALKKFENKFNDSNFFIKNYGLDGNDWFNNESLGSSRWNTDLFCKESINENGLLGYNVLNFSWSDTQISTEIHGNFFNKLSNDRLQDFRFDKWELSDHERISINCISWLGSEFAKFEGKVEWDEEKWLTVIAPIKFKKINCIYGNFLTVHFGYGHQHNLLITENYINKYKNLIKEPKLVSFEFEDLLKIKELPRPDIKTILKNQHVDELSYVNCNLKKDLTDFTFCIPVSFDSKDRLDNFFTCIESLNKIINTNIIILEHGKKSQLMSLPPNCEHYFFEQKDEFFKRNKLLNFGYNRCKTKFAVNMEADCILSPEGLEEAVKALRNDYKFAVPYGYLAFFLDKESSDDFRKKNELPIFWKDYHNFKISAEIGRRNWDDNNLFFNGLCFMFDVEAYRKCGFENENLVQHGWDDYEHYLRVKRLGFKIYNSKGMIYHLYHAREITNNNWYLNYFDNSSPNEFFRIEQMSKKELLEEISAWEWTNYSIN
jgi:hypothetical protein